jgi:ribosomal protein L13
MLKKLHVFAGPTHEHAAQRPIALSIGGQAATGEGE